MNIREIPENFRRLYSKEDIARRVFKLASDVLPWVLRVKQEREQQILAVCILRGGVFFFADLLKEIPHTVEPSFCRAMSYSSKDNTQGSEFRLVVDPAEMKGRHVLLIDDICDSGKTLKNLHDYALRNGAEEVRTAVLIHRHHDDSVYTPDYVGFEYTGSEWFAGYGMEDKNQHSNFPEVYIIDCESMKCDQK